MCCTSAHCLQLDGGLDLLPGYKYGRSYGNLMLLNPPAGTGSVNSLVHIWVSHCSELQLLYRLRSKEWATNIITGHLQELLNE